MILVFDNVDIIELIDIEFVVWVDLLFSLVLLIVVLGGMLL